MLLFAVILELFSSTSALPVPGPPLAPLFSAVVRISGHPDTIFPTACPSACEELFHAEESSFADSNGTGRACACVCPSLTPAFLNTAGYCVGKLDECRRNVAFQTTSRNDRYIPVFSLPSHGGILNPRTDLLWKETGIAVSDEGLVNCSVTSIFTENAAHRWAGHHRRDLFELNSAHRRTVIVWRGDDADATELAGSIVQLKVSCARSLPDEYCVSFRVAGISESAANAAAVAPSSRVEVIVVVLLAALLLLTLLGSFIIWNVCWRMKKEKLVSEIQMQFLNHFRQQNAAKQAAAGGEGHEQIDYGDPQNIAGKRRLFFSSGLNCLEDYVFRIPRR